MPRCEKPQKRPKPSHPARRGMANDRRRKPMTQKAPITKPPTVDEIRAQHEINGARRANTNLIVYALEQLKPGDDRTNVEKLAEMKVEREQAIEALRRLADQLYGEHEWPVDL